MYKYVALFCCVIVLIQASNLFKQDPHVMNLQPQDFDKDTLKTYHTLLFVNFHSSSCSHCKNHAPIWSAFAQALRFSGAHVAAIDCDEFRDTCSQFHISGTPSLKVFNKGAVVMENLKEGLTDLLEVAQDKFGLSVIVDGAKVAKKKGSLKKENVESSPPPKKGKKEKDTSSPSLKLVKMTASPSIRVTTPPPSTTSTLQKIVTKKSSSEHRLANLKKRRETEPKLRILNDASLAIRYGLENGVFLGRFELSTVERTALLNWLWVLKTLFPSPIARWKLDWLYVRVKEAPIPFKSDVFDALLVGWDFGRRSGEAYHWLHCTTSKNRNSDDDDEDDDDDDPGAGYTCGLWLLFHILSVSHAQSPMLLSSSTSNNNNNNNEVSLSHSLHDFVTHFFSCNECRENFLLSNPQPFVPTDPNDAFAFALWLWEEHNKVSKRLNKEEPNSHQHVIFPPRAACHTCVRAADGEFDVGVVVRYLEHAFSNFPISQELNFLEKGVELNLGWYARYVTTPRRQRVFVMTMGLFLVCLVVAMRKETRKWQTNNKSKHHYFNR